MFTVLKTAGGEGKEEAQRVVSDMRRINTLFRKPTGCVLGSGSALASMDLSDATLQGDQCAGAAGDLPSFFYTLSLGSEFGEWVWLEGLELSDFLAQLREENLATVEQCNVWADTCDGVGFTCLPMGWSWAPVIAQRVLEFLLEQAGEPSEARLRHGQGAGEVTRANGANMGYIDDFLIIARDSDETKAMHQAEDRLGKVRSTLQDAKLGCHKEQLGRVLTSLGFEVDLVDREVRPAPEKLENLIRGTRALIRRKRVRPRWLSIVAGHWAWQFTLNTGFFALFQEVYFFLQDAKTPTHPSGPYAGWDAYVELPKDVARELMWAVQLAPLLYADLSAPLDPEVICTDASKWGGASVHATKPHKEVSELARGASSWAGALDAPSPEFFSGPEWKMGFQAPWPEPIRQKHITVLEARTVEIAIRRAVRCRWGRDRRVFFGLTIWQLWVLFVKVAVRHGVCSFLAAEC